MHLNAHLAFSTAITLVLVTILQIPVSFLEIAICIVAGFAIDGDFIFVRFARHKNHRLLLTHSMFVPLAFILLSICFFIAGMDNSTVWTVWLCAITILAHDAVDSIDWGLNFFANGKIVGRTILLRGKSSDDFYAEAIKTTPVFAPFYKAYYGSSTMRILECIAFVAMCVSLAVSWPGVGSEHWWTILVYGGLLGFHMVEYRKCNRIARPSRN